MMEFSFGPRARVPTRPPDTGIPRERHPLRFALLICWVTTVLAFTPLPLHSALSCHTDERGDREERDAVTLTFSIIGDPAGQSTAAASTTVPTDEAGRAWTRLTQSLELRRPNLLFFVGNTSEGRPWPGSAGNTNNGSPGNQPSHTPLTGHAFWKSSFQNLLAVDTYVLPVPALSKPEPLTASSLTPVENAWRDSFGDLILNDQLFSRILGMAPTHVETSDHRQPDDGFITDQTKLCYSFDLQNAHFAVINTDSTGVPAQWLAKDLAAARTRGQVHFFVFGHKPVVAIPDKPKNAASAPTAPDSTQENALWDVIEQNRAIYFCGNERSSSLAQPTASQGGKSWQIALATNGSPTYFGAELLGRETSDVRTFNWCTVKLYRSGQTKILVEGFSHWQSKPLWAKKLTATGTKPASLVGAEFGPARILQSLSLAAEVFSQ